MFKPAVRAAFLSLTFAAMGGWRTCNAWGALVVTQVEARATDGTYASVDFGGKPVKRIADSSSPFSGLIFYGDSGFSATGPDVGGHATIVGQNFYGPNAPGRAYITTVRLLTSEDLLGRILRPTKRGVAAATPAKLPGNPKILNASFTGSSGFNSIDIDLLARMNFLTSRDKLFAAAGAVTSSSGAFQGANLIWGAKNVLAVRGSGSESVFEVTFTTIGKGYANVWGDGMASYATGRVSSMAASLMGEALATKRKVAASPASLRALLMAGADRSATIDASWAQNLINGLDRELGAGKADLSASQSILRAGAATFVSPKDGLIKGSFSPTAKKPKKLPTETAGWASFAVKGGKTFASLFQVENDLQGLSATLTWDSNTKTGFYADLALELHSLMLSDKGDALISPTALLSVDANGDNVRHIAFDGTLEEGMYAWVIRNEGADAVTPGFAFRLGVDGAAPQMMGNSTLTASFEPSGQESVASLPEPGAMLSGLLFAGVSLRRRR